MFIKRFLCGLLALWSCIAVSADGVVVGSNQKTIELTSHLYQWKESAAMPSGAFIGQADNIDWSLVGDDHNKGYISDAYWYRLTLTNPQSESLLRLLEIEYPLLDQIDFYTVANTPNGPRLQQHYVTGDRRHYDERPIHGRTFVFPLTLEAGQTYDIYFRVSSASSHQVSTRLWNFDAYIKYSNEDATFRATYYGSQLMLIVFMIGLYLLMRRRVYLLFGATLLGLLTLQAAIHGVLFQYVLPYWPLIHEYVILTCVPFILIMMLWFSSDYLNLRKNHFGWYRIYRAATLITVAVLLAVFILPYRQATSIGVLLAVPVTLLTVWTGVRLWSQGTKTARIFTLSWMALLAGCLVAILNQLGLLVVEGASQYAIPLGASVQSILMAYALADRFQKDRNDKVKAQEARFDALKQQRDTERAMMRNATRHQVTRLCNRQIFEHVLSQKLKEQKSDERLAIVLWHIQGFNDFQKTLGHENGEWLIKAAAQRLNKAAQDIKEVILLDEEDSICVANVETVTFGCILRSHDEKRIEDIANQLATLLRQPITFKRLSIEFSIQTGCAFSDSQMDVSTLQRHAFIAFDHNLPVQASVTVYHSGMDSYSPRRLTLIGELKTAIEQDTLALHFQPQIDLKSHHVVGFEALLRWHHHEYGFVAPDEFIPIAEETGLIRDVTGWVASAACQFIHRLEEQSIEATVSINISAGNLHDAAFIEQLTDIVASAKVSPSRLILEVTETAAMEDREVAFRALMALHAAGFKLSIDDFGTGYSSLQYLDDLPVDEVKIDRSFVQKMEGEDADDTIIKATITIGHELGFKVLAEGVETAEIRDCLAAKGCDLAQGYYFAKPQASDDILHWLADYQKNH